MKILEELLKTIFTSPLFQCALIAFGVVLGFVIAFCLTELVQE